MTPILQNRQLRFREVKCPDQGHLVRSGAGKPMQVKMKVKSLSRVRLFVTPWTVAY